MGILVSPEADHVDGSSHQSTRNVRQMEKVAYPTRKSCWARSTHQAVGSSMPGRLRRAGYLDPCLHRNNDGHNEGRRRAHAIQAIAQGATGADI